MNEEKKWWHFEAKCHIQLSISTGEGTAYIHIYIYTMIHSLLYTMIPFSSSEKIIDLKKTILTLPEQNATEQNQRTFERGVFLG